MQLLQSAGLSTVRGELAGGAAASVISLTQSMAMGVVAFAPLGPAYTVHGMLAGVYGAIVVTVLSSLFGGTPGLVSGPRASVALVIAAIMAHVVSRDVGVPELVDTPSAAIALVLVVLVLAGLVQVLLGAIRCGALIQLMPYPVIAGFLNAAATLLIYSQLEMLLGLEQAESLTHALSNFDGSTLAGCLVAAVTVIVSFVASRLLKGAPSLFVGFVVGVAVYYCLVAAGVTFAEAGTHSGEGQFDPFVVFLDPIRALWQGGIILSHLEILVPAALSIALLQSFDTLFASVALDGLRNHRSEPDRELVAQGVGGIVAGVLGMFAGSGSLARTMPSHVCGGRSDWASLISAMLMFAAVLLFGAQVERIPGPVIGGVLIVIGLQLYDRWTLLLLRCLRPSMLWAQKSVLRDLAIVLLVLLVALIFGLVVAVFTGLVVAVVEFMIRMSLSPVRRTRRGNAIGPRLARDDQALDIMQRHGESIAIIELEGMLFFGSVAGLEREVDKLIENGARFFIVDMKRVNNLDSTFAQSLVRINGRILRVGGVLTVSYLARERRIRGTGGSDQDRRRNWTLRHMWLQLKFLGVIDTLGVAVFFSDTDSALIHLEGSIRSQEPGVELTNAYYQEANFPIFMHLDATEMDILRTYFKLPTYDPGEIIFNQGQSSDGVYFVVRGRVDVIIDIEGIDRTMRVQTLGKGSMFGEMAVLDTKLRSAAVMAVEPTSCYYLDNESLAALRVQNLDIYITLTRNIALILAKRLRAANLALMELEQ
jgi:sulfate permease, SulP family